ncbi:hypothetical protein PROFUN_02616 [Planoprotostelium fungivorum]|uniref:FAD dependent oxidoreductase n=1 Tax=Planoprotostelium fungivorum TaxID=1890364 RepID=A0A2P6NV83_9EUKA|nr:hypothetical protein PROFUN_02616 [Planoprotostelium fungivorum]
MSFVCNEPKSRAFHVTVPSCVAIRSHTAETELDTTMSRLSSIISLCILVSLVSSISSYQYDVVIYGTTPAAITAAIQITRMGKTVAIVGPETHIGGLTTSGLGWTDCKNSKAIGGIARQFYQKIYYYYLNNSTWTSENRSHYIARRIGAQPGPAIDEKNGVQWTFEPKVAEKVFETWMKAGKIPIYRGEYLNRKKGATIVQNNTIQSFTTLSGKTFQASVFIDAGYEGDLMAAAGISYRVGRDSADDYQEPLAGKRVTIDDGYKGVDPYVIKGNVTSGLLFGIETVVNLTSPNHFTGSADPVRLQSFNFRLSLTQFKNNSIPFTRPSGYDATRYELLLRYLEAGLKSDFTTQLMPNGKTDSNSQGRISFDLLGGNYDWKKGTSYSEASYDKRKEMYDHHRDWQSGLLYTLSNDERVPASLRKRISSWGYARDEFIDNDHWPYQLYVREARRMNGEFNLIQHDAQHPHHYSNDTTIGLASYSLDSHVVRRVVVDGHIYDEGGFYFNNPTFPIPYGCMLPVSSEITNFLNPVTLSASHVAFGSVRMEPTYMILGQAAGTAAVHAIEEGKGVQSIDRQKLYDRLKKDGQSL